MKLRLVFVFLLLVAVASPDIADSFEDDSAAGSRAGQSADMSNAPRVTVDGPAPTFTLAERAPRIHHLPSFQALVDAAPEGSVLRPKPGNYAGPVHLNKQLIIDGGNQVTIDAGDKGTVFVLETSNAVVRNVHLTGSGSSHDTDDACINVRGNNNLLENNTIDNCLFGIDLKQSNYNVVRGNNIRSKDAELGVRGDGLRLWYSMNNRVEKNRVVDSRDMVVWYSNHNVFDGNYGANSRYSIHFMFSHHNLVENNHFYNNAVGIYLMYNEDTVVRNNVITHATGATGMGIGFKEASDAVIEGNEIIYCGLGLSADLSPFQPDSKIVVKNNRLAYNGIAIAFNSDLAGYEVSNNSFEGNISNLSVGGAGSGQRNVWRGNYWDDYEGFDRNKDGIGDTSYDLYAYADQIWMEIPDARFFKVAPAMEVLDFLERLAPFSSPTLLLRDEKPVFNDPWKKGRV